MTIFTPWNSGLGDAIATFSLLARKAAFSGPLLLATNGRGELHEELFEVFQSTGITSVNKPGDTPLSGFDVWAAEPWPTKTRWHSAGGHHIYTYQFDGISSASEKNPPAADQDRIHEHLRSLGLLGVRLDKTWRIADAVNALANSAFFVGCDSGFAHLSLAVGAPTFVLEYALPIVTVFRGKKYIHCAGAGDFIDWKLPTWINYRNFIGTGL